MKTASRALVATLLTIALVGLPMLPEGQLREMSVVERSVPLAFAADEDGEMVSAPVESDATIVGLTWDEGEAPASAEVRVEVDGEWGSWEEVPVDDEHAPDPGSDEAEDARGGTAPIVVEGADAVQFRVDGPETPTRVVAELIDVEDPDAHRRVEGRLGAADAAPARPTIRSRADWNGSSCVNRRPSDITYVNRVQVLFVHHTTGHTSYSRADVPRIIRGICSYHVSSRGWSDIGYNALIDRYGGIWEGRQGGLARGVQGAHTGGFNAWSHGIALIGDHSKQGVTAASQDAVVEYGAWYLDEHNVDPRRRYQIRSSGSSRWSSGRVVTFDAVNGHRAASYTTCPGDYCLAHMGSFMRAMDERGGFKTYGGWPRHRTYDFVGSAWERPTVDLWFDEPAEWTLEIRDDDGRTVWTKRGSGTSATVTWNAVVGGAPARGGDYTVHVDASAVASGRSASPADHPFTLALPPGAFADVPVDHTFHDDIEWLSDEGITRGCNPPGNTRFCPSDPVSRGQMAAFLNRAADLPDAPHAGFRDVPTSHLFADDVANLAAAGITVGCGGGRFCPDDPVTREQMAAFLVRATGVTSTAHPGFVDVPAESTFATDIRRLAAAEITIGCNPPANDRFCPGAPVTRAQMAAFIRRSGL